MSAAPQKIRTGLVELRTRLGPVYVNPSFWERVHLLWTFRNFRSLPKQVLNEREQRLIDNLCRTAVVRRAVPTAETSIIGIVENVDLIPMYNMETSAPMRKTVNMSVTDVDIMPARAVGGISVPFKWAARGAGHVVETLRPRGRIHSISEAQAPHPEQRPTTHHSRLRSFAGEFGYWSGWSVIGLCGLAVIGIRLDLQKWQPTTSVTAAPAPATVQLSNRESVLITPNSIHSTVAEAKKIQPSTPQTGPVKTVVAAANAPIPTKTRTDSSHAANPPHVRMAETKIPLDPQRSQRLQIAEAPAKWSYPIAPDSSLTGNVVLKAVVGKNGNVTEIEVVSGKRALANAATLAVKRWKYHTHEIDGIAVEAEANIKIKFLGDDAVSVSYSKAE